MPFARSGKNSKFRVGLLIASAAVVAAVMSAAPASAATVGLSSPVIPPVPSGSQIKVQGGNGSAAIGTATTPTSRVTPDSEPGGYCGTYFVAYDGSKKVNLLSEGYCSGDIASIHAEAFIYKAGLLKASNGALDVDTDEADTTATYSCGSSCSGSYTGDDSQYFTNTTGWSLPLGSCVIGGDIMGCSGTVGPWTY